MSRATEAEVPLEITRSRKVLPLRWHLLLLIIGTLLPMLLFAVAIVYEISGNARLASEQRILLAARLLAEEIDQEVAGTVRTLRALAESETLEKDEYYNFYVQARRAAATQPSWSTVTLVTSGGRQLVNTARGFGSPLPPVSERESLQRVIETRQPALGNLSRGKAGGRWAFPVRVPVMRGGKLRYVLTAVITPEALASVVKRKTQSPDEWNRSIVDGEGKIVVRTRNPEKYTGHKANPSFIQHTSTTVEGTFRNITLDGMDARVATRRLEMGRWTAAVSVPVSLLEAPARRAMALIFAMGCSLLLVSVVGALLLSRRITRPIASAAAAAEALAQGDVPRVEAAGVAEVAALGRALESSAELLLRREQELNEHLARSEAARHEAEIANSLKDEFLATLSHELRTPLTAIVGWVHLLREDQESANTPVSRQPVSRQVDPAADQVTIARGLETIERNARALAVLVDDLLDMSRITTGKLQLNPELVDIKSVVESAAESVRPAATAKGIKLGCELQLTEAVWGDVHRLQQVLWNLLSNAVKFAPNGGEVGVRLSQVDSSVHLSVWDNGIGIPAEFLPHMFDRFRQADGSSTRKVGGLGLGLAIVRQLVEMHGGTVQASSDGPNTGATFTVILPAAVDASDPPTEAKSVAAATS